MTQPVEPAYRYIPLTHGRFTKVSAHRFDYLNQWQWHATRSSTGAYYAVRAEGLPDGKQKTVIMARVIMDAPDGIDVDHVSRDTLDNSDENLRFATRAQSAANRKQRSDSRWPYKGIYQMHGRWCALITVKGKRHFLGGFDTPEQARDTYVGAANRLVGEFACFDHREHVISEPEIPVKTERAPMKKRGPRPVRAEIKQPNDPSIRYIPLTKGQIAIISAHRYEEISKFYWYAMWSPERKKYYAARSEYVNGKTRTIWLHKVIHGAPPGVIVDHENRNSLDCRDENLRVATKKQNNANNGIRRDNTTGFKGVVKRGEKYVAQISINGVTKGLGYFPSPELAYDVYCKENIRLRGEFACLD